MKRFLLACLLASICIVTATAQRKTDALDRGLVAAPAGSGMFVSWRVQADEYYDVTYNLYRNGSLIAQNLTASNYSDTSGSASSSYTVAAVRNGVVGSQCAAVKGWNKQYLEIPVSNVQARNGVTVWKQNDPSSAMANYTINDISLGDVDGDGKIDFIVKRKNQTDQDELFPTTNYQMYCQIEVYASSISYGRLWWIDCGPNICYGADEQWDAVAFDWNEDGACEVLYRGGANTVIHHSDGSTETIGNASENIRGSIVHTANMTFSNTGEEWLMYIDGRTGKTYDAITYPLARGNASDWGDSYGHRSSKYFMGAPYLDGVNPYIFLGRGIYTKINACTYRVNKNTNKLYKVGNTWQSYTNKGWYSQGYHNFSIADVDLDGSDEIIYGSMVLDFHTSDTSLHGMASTGLGHGDASHTGDLDPYRRGLETFACNEEQPAFNFRNAATCEIYARGTSSNDDGRSMAGNFTNEYPGGIGASTTSGIVPLSYVQSNPYSPTFINGMTNNWNGQTPYPMALNFRLYWDGDLLSETLNGPGSSEGYLFVDKLGQRIYDTGHGNYETACINGTKKNPCALGDILGDWREEIVMRSSDNRYIRVYTTVTPTEYRMPSLWYDHQYRQAMVWQTEGYNQPPHPSFFVGELEGLTQAPPPLTWTGRTGIGNGGSINGAHKGKDVFIWPDGNGSEYTVTINEGAQPSTVFLNSRTTIEGGDQVAYTETKHTYDRIWMKGAGLSGSTNLCKQGASAAHLPYATHTHTGKTDVWMGALISGGSITNSPIWANIHTELFLGSSLDASTSTYKSIEMEYGSALYITSHAISVPLINNNGYAHMTVGDLCIKEGSRIVFDINGTGNASGDKLNITGDISVRKRTWEYGPTYSAPVFEFISAGQLAEGEYELGDFGALASGSLGDIVVETPNGKAGSVAQIYAKGTKYYLHIGNSRVVDAAGDPWGLAGNTYYIYNELQDKFLSRNGNEAYVDEFGVPVYMECSGSMYSLKQVDNGLYYNGMYWTNATGSASAATKYKVNAVDGVDNTFTLSNTTNPADDGNMYINVVTVNRVANNSSAANTPDLRNSYWKFLTASERNEIIANRVKKAALAAAAAAGVSESATYEDLATLVADKDCTSAIPNTTFGLSAVDNVYEVYQGTANLTQTATGLKKGLYRVTLPALYREGGFANCAAQAKYGMSIAYLSAGDAKVQIADWASGYSETSNPNTRAEANVKFNDGKYSNVVYAYVAEDNGSLPITIGCPINIDFGWLAFGAIKLELLSTTIVKTTVYDFANWTESQCTISNNKDGQYTKVGTAWETGNARYQDIYSCTAPSVMENEFAFQAVTNEWNGKGTIIREGYGMGMMNATRSAAILNLNKGAVVTFSIADATNYPIDFTGGGNGDGTWNVEAIDGGYRVTMLTAGNLGFCLSKGAYNNANSYVSKIVVENPQGEQSEETSEPETPAVTPILANGDYYIMNVKSGLFLNGANSWGTKASVTIAGQLMTLKALTDGTYYVDSHITNGGENHYLGAGDNTYIDSEAKAHTIECAGEGLFTIKNGDKYLAAGDDNIVNFNADAVTAATQWRILTKAQMLEIMNSATKENPVNATFLISDPNFSRNNTYFDQWVGDNISKPTGTKDQVLIDNMNVEKWGGNSQTFDSYQVIELPNGIYTLRAQGFYRYNNTTDNTNDIASAAHANNTEVIYSFLYANDQISPLMSIADDNAVSTNGYMPFSQTQAAEAFNKGLYWNEVDVEVTDGSMRLGIKKTNHIGCDWTVWDNFQLYYKGVKEAEPVFALGDVNHDGYVNFADVTALTNIVICKAEDTFNAADINKDGSINIADIATLINILLGK